MTYVNWQVKQTVFVKNGPRKLEVPIINTTGVNSGYGEAVLLAAAKKHILLNK
jgi:hypothetical protein